MTSAQQGDSPGACRHAHIEEVAGTVVSLHLLGSEDAPLEAARRAIFEFLHRMDDVFSVTRDDSVLRRWQREEIAATGELQDVLALAGTVAILTHGAFDPKWNGAPDPSGIVQGWAVDRAVEIAASHGVTNLVINAGGNIGARGSAGSGGPWRVGVADPAVQRNVLSIVGHELNVATSGAGARGSQIRSMSERDRTTAAATVVGPNVAIADGIATGAIAAGSAAQSLLVELDASGWLSQLIGLDGTVWRSPSFARLLSQ